MATKVPRTTLIGDLVVAAFDGAARYSTDPSEVSRLATSEVMHVLLRASRAALQTLWSEGGAPLGRRLAAAPPTSFTPQHGTQ